MDDNIICAINDVVKISALSVSAYKIPTQTPESDGTIKWNSTTLILVELIAGDKTGIGYTYADEAAATIIKNTFDKIIVGMDCMNIPAITNTLINKIRNDGNTGIAMMAVSAVDNALWDLKAKIFDVPLYSLLGQSKDKMLIYGSGGFTSYTNQQLQEQLSNWSAQGMVYVKMKIGRHPEKDVQRVKAAREAINTETQLFVDANGAYTAKQALDKANQFSAYNVTWFEEPVTSANLEGLHFIKEHAPAQMNIAAGEYGFNLPYFQHMLDAKAVDVLQADATRCGGITGFLKAGHLCEAYQLPFSSHCAPSVHLHAALALPSFYIAEYFFDHARIETMLFDGVCVPKDGYIKPDSNRPGLGIEFKYKDAAKYKI